MAASTSFREFCQKVGYVPLRSASSEAFAVIGAFFVIYLLLYGPFLIVAIPAHWLMVHMLVEIWGQTGRSPDFAA